MGIKKRALLWFPQDFLTGTAFMTNEEVGKYIRLLMYLYEVGPMNTKQIEQVTGELNENVLSKLEKDKNGFYDHHRIRTAREKGDVDTLNFAIKSTYHKDPDLNKFGIEYSKAKKMHINPEMLFQIEKLFNDKRFKRETVVEHINAGLTKWKMKEGSSQFNFSYLHAIIKGDLDQTFGKHKELKAAKLKQIELAQIEKDRLEAQQVHEDEAKTPAIELADMFNKRKEEEQDND